MFLPKVLIVSATFFEVEGLFKNRQLNAISNFTSLQNNVDVLVTGVGMVNTAFALGNTNLKNYNLIINAGIAGAFDYSLKLGETIIVEKDTFSELGAEDGEIFITINDLNLGEKNTFTQEINTYKDLILYYKKVSGITVNNVHGNENSISNVKKLFNTDVETMEGAAFLKCCATSNAEFFQIRSISNYVEKRDKSKWQIPLAISNLTKELEKLITELTKMSQGN